MKKHSSSAAVAVLIAGLLTGIALLSASPAAAVSFEYSCRKGEFCMYFRSAPTNSGYYHFEGSDPNLDNDHYEGADTGWTVGNTARYLVNNGAPGPSDDVVVYDLPGYRGDDACISRGSAVRLVLAWSYKIESYRWVSDAECARAGFLPAGEL